VIVRDPPRLLPLITGVAAAEEVGPEAQVKWPNDVLLKGRKVAGVLVESRPQENWAVLGIGLNVAVCIADLPPELSVRAGTLGRPVAENPLSRGCWRGSTAGSRSHVRPSSRRCVGAMPSSVGRFTGTAGPARQRASMTMAASSSWTALGASRLRLVRFTLDEAAPSLRKQHALELFSGLPSRYDRMGAVMSFGEDPRWRRALVDALAPGPGDRVLDVATGTGMVAFALARRGCEVVGIDQSGAMLAGARAKLARAPELGSRVSFVCGEAERLPFPSGHFDALSFTYLLRYVDDRSATLAELARVVRQGGRIGMLEFGVPRQPVLRALWRAHTRWVLPAMGRFVSPAWFEVGRFLGPNIESFHREEPDLVSRWERAGIGHVSRREMSFGAGLIMWGVKG
jgi:demethylmenaquinone methyltransferase/2-methoxy-6-polyprenyl-1,4-benzoquinol methylase